MKKRNPRRLVFADMYRLSEFLKKQAEVANYIGWSDSKIADDASSQLNLEISDATIKTVREAAELDFSGEPTLEERVLRLEKRLDQLEFANVVQS